jgi:uncharacterized repeat protein (TIGR03803 family)
MARPSSLVLFAVCFAIFAVATAQAQYQVLYTFGALGSSDAAYPNAGLVSDADGNLYGTSYIGGPSVGGGENGCLDGCGTVFRLSPQASGVWMETILHNFCSTANIYNCPDGAIPGAGLLKGKSGKFYGTTKLGGLYGAGTVFELSPPSARGGGWVMTELWSFCAGGGNCLDGANPTAKLIEDSAGNIYGTTGAGGGIYYYGTAFELTPVPVSSWTMTTLHVFNGEPTDGRDPGAGLILDPSGNLYGTTRYGGDTGCGDIGCGTVFQLSPNGDGTWTENILARGAGQQVYPSGDLSLDKYGNIYGTNYGVANNSQGGVFELDRAAGWKPIDFSFDQSDGANPYAGVLVANGVLYGTTSAGGAQSEGTIFTMTGRTETVLYNFCSLPNCVDGVDPGFGGLLLTDRAGNLYGTATEGGANNNGVVFEFTP